MPKETNFHQKARLITIITMAISKEEKKRRKDKENLEKIREYKRRHGIDEPLTQVQCVAILSGSRRKPVKKAKRKKTRKSKRRQRKNETFYESREWRDVRYEALKLYDRRCVCCGRKPPEVQLHVDHIKPRSKRPDLELDINNLQIMCKDCNLGKSNKDSIDYR